MVYATQVHGQALDRGAMLSDLLDLETNWWKTDLMQVVFNEDKGKEICVIVVCPQTRCDKLVWAGAKNGDFTIRSA